VSCWVDVNFDHFSALYRLTNCPQAVTWLWTVAHAQINNRILELFNHVYTYATPECPNLVEINVTGGSRFFFTREPEHVKTILTSKFAEYGKGPEFHRVWVSSPGPV